MLISVTLEEKSTERKVIWAEKIDNDSFMCPKCQKGSVKIIYKDGIPQSRLRCNSCRAKYSVNLTL